MYGKNAGILAAVATATLTFTSAQATPRSGASSGQHFLVAAEDLNSWHVGAYVRSMERDVEADNFDTKVDLDRILAVVGYDVLPWLTVFGTVGGCEASEEFGIDNELAVEYGIGTWFNLLDHDTFDFLEMIQRYRVQGTLQYTMFNNDEFTWGEVAGNVTFGVTHEVVGSKFFWPEAVSVFIGPCLNMVVSDEYDVASDDIVGLTAGGDFQISERTALGVAWEKYPDDTAVTGYVMARF